jgi:short-subunit dehydrogenase
MEPRFETTKPKVVLLTGASAGLGLSISKLLCQTNYRLILTARKPSLARFTNAGIVETERTWLRPLDVTSSEERENVIGEAEQRWGGVDILINNAGVTYRSVVEHMGEEDRLHQLNVNFRAPMELIRLVLPGMRAKRAGRIINISSVGGMMAMPTMALYSASKFALEGATEALWYEVRPWSIMVTLLQPGFIRSASFRNTVYTAESQEAAADPKNPYYGHYHHMAAFISKLMMLTYATPERIAQKVLRLMRRRRPPLRVPATFDASVFAFLRRWLPREIYHAVLYCGLPSVKCWGTMEPKQTAIEPKPKEPVTTRA